MLYYADRVQRWKEFRGKQAPDGIRAGTAFEGVPMCECGRDQAFAGCDICINPERCPVDPEQDAGWTEFVKTSTKKTCLLCVREHYLCDHAQLGDHRKMVYYILPEAREVVDGWMKLVKWAAKKQDAGVEGKLIDSALFTAFTNNTEPVLPDVAAPLDQQLTNPGVLQFVVEVFAADSDAIDKLHDKIAKMRVETPVEA